MLSFICNYYRAWIKFC